MGMTTGLKPVTEYVVYRGEDLLCMGNAKECAEQLDILPASFRFYLTPSYQRRIAKRKNARNYIEVIRLEDED